MPRLAKDRLKDAAAAQAAEADRGVRCPNCACRHSEVVWIEKVGGRANRRCRQCRHCGKRYATTELVGGARR